MHNKCFGIFIKGRLSELVLADQFHPPSCGLGFGSGIGLLGKPLSLELNV